MLSGTTALWAQSVFGRFISLVHGHEGCMHGSVASVLTMVSSEQK